jgi:hypothetical protein
MKSALLILVLASLALAQNPLTARDPYPGKFQGDQISLEMTGTGGRYSGSLTFQGNKLAVTVTRGTGNATGTFAVNGSTYSFVLTPTANGLKLTSDGEEFAMGREGQTAAVPAAAAAGQAAPSPSASSSIVGSWRNPNVSARFNADGTGVIDGQPGRYEIRGNQITLIGAQGPTTLPFEVRGDTLTLTVNGAPLVFNRVPPDTGIPGIRPELVGKWCYISIVNANQGARQSNQCITLEANGAYSYVGETDSYNPFGGSTSQSSDSGTWVATETTLTARSRSGRTTVYTLEKRNHPRNVRDPMIVLNGQAFVTFFNKPAW